jgi:putative alpha-1,2-mannosidase
MGGEKAFVNKLQECFDGGHYDASNEPDLGWPYLFDYVPQEGWRAQKQAREAMAKAYGTGPDGLPGNDDTGAMSAWYVFSALGFYPVCPGSNSYCVGSPIFREADLHLNKAYYRAGLVVLKCVNNSDRNVYIQSLTVNGVPTKGNFLSHETLTSGKSIVFKMGAEPAGTAAQLDEPR